MSQRIKVREPFVTAPTRESLVSNKSRIREQLTGTPATKSKRSTRDTYAELAEVMRGLGLNDGEARRAVVGRDGEVIREAVRNVAGLSSRCFAWVPDEKDPTTWALQLCRIDNDGDKWQPEEDLVRAAVKQVTATEMSGESISIPDGDLAKVLSVLRSAWIDLALPLEEMPDALAQLDLVNALRSGGGMTVREAMAAARGRAR